MLAAALAQLLTAVALAYASALGFLALWMATCAAQGRDPWIHDRSSR